MNKISKFIITTLMVVFSSLYGLTAQVCDNGLQKCEWEQWSKWSPCSKTCGIGTRTRSRGICCKEDSFEKCLKECAVPNDSWQTESCEYVCPSGNCTFDEVTDTGIEATDYVTMTDGKGVIINTPIILTADKSFCERSCLDANLQSGLHCWTYSYSQSEGCKLYFFSKPLSLAHPDKKGGAPGKSIYVRHCTGVVSCEATSADIIFVVDSSGSIGLENFQKIKAFIQSLVNGFDIDRDLTRVGLMTYNDHATWQFKLGQHDSKMELLKAVEKIPYIIGSTQTADALETLRKEGFTNKRPGVPTLAVVITDGLSRYPSLTKVRAALLRDMGVLMYAIGIGNNTDHTELFNMASIPEERYMYEFNDYDDLDNVTLDVNYVKCKAKVDQTNGTSNDTNAHATTNNCTDTIDNCAGYGRDVCTDFADWARQRCSLYCGFCQEEQRRQHSTCCKFDTSAVTTQGPCFDKLPNCASYGEYVCQSKDFIGWVRTNCRKFCGICKSTETTRPTTQTTTTVKICADTIDNCAGYAPACNDTRYRGFLEARCPAFCGYCKSYEVIEGKTVNGVKCPDWNLPTECTLEFVAADCCPLPHCPAGYTVTAEKIPS